MEDSAWVPEDLVRLVGVGDHLGGVTEEEHDHDRGQQGSHGVVSPLMGGGGGGESAVDGSASTKTF